VTASTQHPRQSAGFHVHEVNDEHGVNEVRRLVLEYAASMSTKPGVEHLRADAAALPGRFALPRGGLWLATADDAGTGVGCVAVRPLDDDIAEVKRMYVDAAWRGRGVGRALLEALIAGARERGYAKLRLGTLEEMKEAQSLYHSVGFRPIERYRPDEIVDTIFYERSLR
jgi:GNAT superfamily N-acetyltransferase